MENQPTREEIKAKAEEIYPAVLRVAEVKGWGINENKDIADSIVEGLARNVLLRGKKYCPCVLPSGDEEEDKKYICPCRNSAKDVEETGHCHCYLYMRK
ncbi:MAG TPA: ferredoxin:thioredoxin reductase [Methanocorpusculum sp.]|nr:ferredoxin:thioredoxin reductase [Methanocorpusculum sp.]